MNMQGKTLAIDLDGTLFYPKKHITMISKKNVVFVRKFIDDGGRVVLVTGRNYNYAFKSAKKVGRDLDFIACNSTYIYSGGKVMRNEFISAQESADGLQYISKTYNPLALLLFSKTKDIVLTIRPGLAIIKVFYWIWYQFQGAYKEDVIISDAVFKKELVDGNARKILVFFGFSKKQKAFASKANKELYKMFPNMEFSWSDSSIEITPKGIKIAEGLEFYCQHNNLNHDEVYVIGDSGNDISTFKAFKNSFCMAHAHPSVKKYAQHIVKRVYN